MVLNHTITAGGTSIVPDAIQAYRSSRQSRNIVHPILGRESSDVTLRPASLRTGEMELVFFAASDAIAAEQLHAAGAVLELASDFVGVPMSYVVPEGGRIDRTLESATRRAWILTVSFQEVAE